MIRAGDRIVGESDLERGDPAMGFASGRFRPMQDFGAFVRRVEPDRRGGGERGTWNGLTAANPEGVPPECAGVSLLRYDLDDEVDVIAIRRPFHEDPFPHHRDAHGRRFQRSDA